MISRKSVKKYNLQRVECGEKLKRKKESLALWPKTRHGNLGIAHVFSHVCLINIKGAMHEFAFLAAIWRKFGRMWFV